MGIYSDRRFAFRRETLNYRTDKISNSQRYPFIFQTSLLGRQTKIEHSTLWVFKHKYLISEGMYRETLNLQSEKAF